LPACCDVAGEQVQVDVGAELVEAAAVSFFFEAPGEPVDPVVRPAGLVGVQLDAAEVGGPVEVGPPDHLLLRDGLLVAGLGGFGLGLEA